MFFNRHLGSINYKKKGLSYGRKTALFVVDFNQAFLRKTHNTSYNKGCTTGSFSKRLFSWTTKVK